MVWHLQTPNSKGPTLLKSILAHCGPAQAAGAAFAFASAKGVQMLAAEPVFSTFLKTADFSMVVGLDAITDVKAIAALQKLAASFPRFKLKLFLHSKAGALFHPKTLWLKTPKGGVVITGSGNLTAGGLQGNWEATVIETLSAAEMSGVQKDWHAWLKQHAKELRDLNDADALTKAKANTILRVKIKKTLTGLADKPTEEAVDAAEELAGELVEEIEQEFLLNPVLIAEVPKNGGRWQQVNFDVKSFQEYFGVTLGVTKHVRFYHVQNDGARGMPEDRPSVEVGSQNYRFEIGAAHGLAYPAKGRPILVFEKTAKDTFDYVLLMPGTAAHGLVQKFLNKNYARKGNQKLRVQITAGDLQKAWPDSPLLL